MCVVPGEQALPDTAGLRDGEAHRALYSEAMRRRLPTPDEALRILGEKRSRPARRAPPPAGAALARSLKGLEAKFGKGSGVGPLRARWREVAGELLAPRTEPVRIIRPRGGGPAVLEVRVDGPAAALVQHQAPELIGRAELVLGAGAVGKLRIVQGPVRAPVAAAPKPRRRTAAPLDAASEAELAAALSEASDTPLKAALLRLGRAVRRSAD